MLFDARAAKRTGGNAVYGAEPPRAVALIGEACIERRAGKRKPLQDRRPCKFHAAEHSI